MASIQATPAAASREQRRITAAAMLNVERPALALLQRIVQQATAGRAPVAAARSLQGPVSDVLARVRAVARREGASRMQAELDAMVPQLADAGAPRLVVPPLAVQEDADRLRAERAAMGLAGVYLSTAEGVEEGRERSRALWGSPKVKSRIELDVATEVSTAFNDERFRAELALKEKHRGQRWLPAVLKQWDAMNDRRTCPRCAERDGGIVALGQTFGGESAGKIHPRCRCFEALIFAPIYVGREDKERPAA